MEYYKKILDLLDNPDPKSLEMSMDDVHVKGLFSLVIAGTEHGKLTRAFIASKKIKPFDVQLHTHRYGIKLTVLKGAVVQHEASMYPIASNTAVFLPLYHYKSPLNGGKGLTYMSYQDLYVNEFIIPVGATIRMSYKDIHTISCSKDAIWIVEELGFKEDESFVYGKQFDTYGLYNQPKQFQVNNNHQVVRELVKSFL